MVTTALVINSLSWCIPFIDHCPSFADNCANTSNSLAAEIAIDVFSMTWLTVLSLVIGTEAQGKGVGHP